MAGIEDRFVGDTRQTCRKRLIHGLWVASGEVRSPAAVQEERVARYQPAVGQEALATRGMPWRVKKLDLQSTHFDNVATLVWDELVALDTRRARDPRDLRSLHVHGHVDQLEELCHPFDVQARKVSTHVVWVVMGCEHAYAAHLVRGKNIEKVIDCVRRVDDHGVACTP